MRGTKRCVFSALGVFLCAMPAAAQSHTVTFVKDLDYVATSDYPDGKDRLDLYIPQGVSNAPVIFSLHGGALSMGDRGEESFVGQRFAAAGYLTVVASYRLSPQVSHPAHIQDAAAAFAWVKRNIRQHGGDPDRIIVIGHSAGAYLATPSRYLRADLPPVLLIDTDGDEEWRQQQNADMAAALRSAGHKDVDVHKVKGRTHMSVWTKMLDGESEETSSRILLFAKRVLAEKGN